MAEALERAANVPLPLPLIVTHGAPRLPPSGSTAGSALSPTPPQGGSDTRASCAGLKNHSPLEGESQKPSRQAKADAVGGPTNTRYLAHSTSVPALRSPPFEGESQKPSRQAKADAEGGKRPGSLRSFGTPAGPARSLQESPDRRWWKEWRSPARRPGPEGSGAGPCRSGSWANA